MFRNIQYFQQFGADFVSVQALVHPTLPVFLERTIQTLSRFRNILVFPQVQGHTRRLLGRFPGIKIGGQGNRKIQFLPADPLFDIGGILLLKGQYAGMIHGCQSLMQGLSLSPFHPADFELSRH